MAPDRLITPNHASAIGVNWRRSHALFSLFVLARFAMLGGIALFSGKSWELSA